MVSKNADARAEEAAIAADLALHNKPSPGEQAPGMHRTVAVFVRVLREDDNRPEVVHTPGEGLPPEVAAALDAGKATAGADGVILVDLR